MALTETTDHKGLLSAIGKSAKQVRFAGILSLTRTAVIAQKDVRKSLDKNFELKNKWTALGIRIKPAQKGDKPEPFAEVFSKDWYISQHERGTKRDVPKKADRFFIPGNDFESILKINPDKKLIPKKYKMDRILKGKINGIRPFRTRIKGQEVIAVRKTKKSRTIGILYILEDEPVRIRGKSWFDETVRKSYDRNIEQVYNKALIDALRSAR